MAELVEYLKVGEIVIGLLVGAFMALIGFFAWWDRRTRTYADNKVLGVQSSNRQVIERLAAVESDLKRVDNEIHDIKSTIGKLPTQQDFVALKVSLGEQNATLTHLSGMVRTLYEAALRASEDRT